LIVAAFGALNLRLLGFIKQFPVGPLHRLLPWGIAGVIINIATGMLFFVGMPFFYDYNPVLYMKISAIVIAGATLVFFYCTGAFRSWANLAPGRSAGVREVYCGALAVPVVRDHRPGPLHTADPGIAEVMF